MRFLLLLALLLGTPPALAQTKPMFRDYFVHQSGEPGVVKDPRWARRSVLQIAELVEREGKLTVDREKPAALPKP